MCALRLKKIKNRSDEEEEVFQDVGKTFGSLFQDLNTVVPSGKLCVVCRVVCERWDMRVCVWFV